MKKTAVIYWSGTGNTEAMANAVAEGMRQAGAECSVLTSADVTADTVAAMFDGIKSALAGKAVALFGSYGWGDGEWMRTWEEDCASAGIRLAADSVTCCEAPDDEALSACQALGKKLAE